MAEVNAEFEQIWAEAFSLYQEKTKRDLKSDPVLRDLRTTDDLLKHIELRDQQFKDFRQKKAQLWAILRSSMAGVEVLGGLTQNTLTLTPFSMASPVLGAVLFLVGSAKGVSEAYDSITELLSELEDFAGRLEEYTRAALDPKLMKKMVTILTTLLEIFARSEKLIKKGRVKQYISGIGGNEKVASAMTRLKSLIDTENRLVGSLVYSTVLKTNETVDRSEKAMEQYDKTLRGVTGSLNDMKKETNEKAEQERLKTLDKDEVLEKVQDKYKYFSERMLAGTGDWIKEEPLFKAWISEEIPILWILGGPGAGKSFLSSKIISHMQGLHAQDPNQSARISIGYFFVKEDDERLRSLNAIFKCVALQIANHNPVYKKHVVNVCASRDTVSTAKSTWQSLFLDFFGSQQNVDSRAFVVIDGLDEAPKAERETFLELLRSLKDYPRLGSSARPSFSFVIIGRPDLQESIADIWESRTAFIEVSAAKNNDDIEKYIKDGMHKVRALKNKRIPLEDREKLRADILSKSKEGANGMFLWVNLMLDQLRAISRPSDIRTALEQAPHDLAQMIRKVFERLAGDPDVQRDDLNEILIWTTFARTRLLLGQMDVILKLRGKFGEPMYDLEDRLRGQFSSLFTLERKDKMTTESLQLAIQDDICQEMPSHEEPSSDQADEQSNWHQPVEDHGEEDDVLRKYDSDFNDTLLGFSHASIRDYLVQEGRPSTRRYPVDLGIGVDYNKAEHHITATCLSILCDIEHEDMFLDSNILMYAAENFLKHLQAVDRSSLSKQEKQIIARPLFTVFQDGAIIERWFDQCSDQYALFVQGCLKGGDLARCVRDWFADEGNIFCDFTTQEKEQALYASRSDFNLFERLARHCASQWLSGKNRETDPELNVWVLHVYLDLSDQSSQSDSTEDVRPTRLLLSDLPLKRLRALAEYGGFEKNAYWHRRLGRVYMDAAYNNAAIKEYNISIKMDSRDSYALQGLAFCYEERKDYLSAIEWHYKALAALPKESRVQKAEILLQISECKTLLEDMDGAVEASHEAYSISPGSFFQTQNAYLTALEKDRDFAAIMNFAASLETKNSPYEGENRLTYLFIETWDWNIIAHAASRLGEIGSLDQSMRKAVEAAERRNIPPENSKFTSYELHFQYFLLGRADFLNTYAYNIDEAIETCERVLSNQTPSQHFSDLRKMAKHRLSELYYHKAKAAECAGIRFDHWVTKLEGLANTSSIKDGNDVSTSKDSSLMLGLWYRLHGREQEAKLCFRTQILDCIDTLTDDDPSNNMSGYCNLAPIFLIAGDRDNAGAAFAVTTVPLDMLKDNRRGAAPEASDEHEAFKVKSRTAPLYSTVGVALAEPQLEPPGSKDTEENSHPTNDNADVPDDKMDMDSAEMNTQIKPEDDKSRIWWSCDGQCNRRVEDWEELHFCEICRDICFCDQCIKLVKSGSLPFRKWEADHTFYQAYPPREDLRDVATVRTEGKIVPRAEWVEALRKEWAS